MIADRDDDVMSHDYVPPHYVAIRFEDQAGGSRAGVYLFDRSLDWMLRELAQRFELPAGRVAELSRACEGMKPYVLGESDEEGDVVRLNLGRSDIIELSYCVCERGHDEALEIDGDYRPELSTWQ